MTVGKALWAVALVLVVLAILSVAVATSTDISPYRAMVGFQAVESDAARAFQR